MKLWLTLFAVISSELDARRSFTVANVAYRATNLAPVVEARALIVALCKTGKGWPSGGWRPRGSERRKQEKGRVTPVCSVIGSLESHQAARDVQPGSRSVTGIRRENHTSSWASPRRGHNPLNGCPGPSIISSFHERKFSEEVPHEGLEGCGRMPGVAPGKLGEKYAGSVSVRPRTVR